MNQTFDAGPIDGCPVPCIVWRSTASQPRRIERRKRRTGETIHRIPEEEDTKRLFCSSCMNLNTWIFGCNFVWWLQTRNTCQNIISPLSLSGSSVMIICKLQNLASCKFRSNAGKPHIGIRNGRGTYRQIETAREPDRVETNLRIILKLCMTIGTNLEINGVCW